MFGHFILNGFSLHSNYIQIHNNKDYSWEYKHYMFNKQFFNLLGFISVLGNFSGHNTFSKVVAHLATQFK